MANAIYPKWKQELMQGSPDTSLTGTVKAALVDTETYTYSASHQFLSDISGVVGNAQTLSNKTFTDGVFKNTATTTWSAVSGASVGAIVLYVDTGNAGTSRLVAYIDSEQTGLPVTPNGGDITMTWDSGSNGIFAL